MIIRWGKVVCVVCGEGGGGRKYCTDTFNIIFCRKARRNMFYHTIGSIRSVYLFIFLIPF